MLFAFRNASQAWEWRRFQGFRMNPSTKGDADYKRHEILRSLGACKFRPDRLSAGYRFWIGECIVKYTTRLLESENPDQS